MVSDEVIFFLAFLAGVFLVLGIDLGVFSKKDHVVSFKEAGLWSLLWVGLAFGFYFLLLYHGDLVHGIDNMVELGFHQQKYAPNLIMTGPDYLGQLNSYRTNMALEFITGYMVEYALSVDNIFVIILIFTSFRVDKRFYKKILFWGILGALVMRFTFIFLGSALIQQFGWIMYIFGGFLVFTGIRMLIKKDDDENFDTAGHPIVRLTSKYLAVYPSFVRERFFLREGKRFYITPLFLVLLVIEFTDLIFAVDSVPAVFAVTKDPYIIFFSNIFAILGLRSMFFFLASIMHLFHYLKVGLAALLVFIGGKMFIGEQLHHWGFTNAHSFYIILGILGISIGASLLFPGPEKQKAIK